MISSVIVGQKSEKLESDLLKEHQLTLLKQISLDCGVDSNPPSCKGLFQIAPIFISHSDWEIRQRGLKLLFQVLWDNRSSVEFFKIATNNENPNWVTGLIERFSVIADSDAQEEFNFIRWIFALMELETGRRELTDPSILTSLLCKCEINTVEVLVTALAKRISDDLCAAILSALLEHGQTGSLTRQNLSNSLKPDNMWKSALTHGSLISLFLLFRAITESNGEPISSQHIHHMVEMILPNFNELIKNPGRFPYLYVYICIFHSILTPKNLNFLSRSFELGTKGLFGWLYSKDEDKMADLSLIVEETLNIYYINLNCNRDKYLNDMINAILVNAFPFLDEINVNIQNQLKRIASLARKSLVSTEILNNISVWTRSHPCTWASLDDLPSLDSLTIPGPVTILQAHDCNDFFVPLIHLEISRILTSGKKGNAMF